MMENARKAKAGTGPNKLPIANDCTIYSIGTIDIVNANLIEPSKTGSFIMGLIKIHERIGRMFQVARVILYIPVSPEAELSDIGTGLPGSSINKGWKGNPGFVGNAGRSQTSSRTRDTLYKEVVNIYR